MRHLIITISLFLFVSSFAETKTTYIFTTPQNNLGYQDPVDLNDLDNFTDTAVAFVRIDSLRTGEKYSIDVVSNGCFHHSELYLTITKSADGYFAEFKIKGKIEGAKVRNTFKKRKINPQQIDSIRAFENKLFQLSKQSYGCTTVDNYYLMQGEKRTSYTVDDCDWNGMGKLVGYLFKK